MIDEMTYKTILENFGNPSLSSYVNIIEICSNNIDRDYNNAAAHYIISMAMFGIATLIEGRDEIYAYINSEPVKYSNFRYGRALEKMDKNMKFADNAVDEFNIAYNLDKNIIEKHPYIRITVGHKLTDAVYTFSRPIPAKDVNELIFQDKKWTFVGILLVLTTVITLIASIFLPENTCVIIFLIGASIAIMSIFLYPNENKIMLNKYKKYITK